MLASERPVWWGADGGQAASFAFYKPDQAFVSARSRSAVITLDRLRLGR